MDKNLANYIFHNETLYFENKTGEIEPVKPAVEIKEPIKEPPQKAIAQDVKKDSLDENEVEPFKMNTNHLIVINDITSEERAFLVKVLMALNMSLAKVDLLNTTKYNNPDFKEIIYNNSVQTILFLGEGAGEDFLPKLKLDAYTVKEIKNIRFLSADTLLEISLNRNNEKRRLWEALRQLY